MSSRHEEGRHGRSRQPGEHKSLRPRATDQEIQKWVARQYGFVPESGWIMRCKEEFGLAAPGNATQENPCPPDKKLGLVVTSAKSEDGQRSYSIKA